jgi:hypothetical protein
MANYCILWAGKPEIFGIGVACQIHMEWDGGFASFLVMLSHVPIPNTYVFLPNTALVHACCV